MLNGGGNLKSTYADQGATQKAYVCVQGGGGSKFMKILRMYYVGGHKSKV